MPEDELRALIAAYQKNQEDQKTLTKITEECYYLVEHMAKVIWYKISQTGAVSLTSYEDLEAEGFLGLVKALKGFDPERKVKVATYSQPRIRGAILDYLRRLDLPRATRGYLNRYARSQEILEKANPDPEEIALALKVTEKVATRIFRTAALNKGIHYLSTPTYEKENTEGVAELGDSIPDSESSEHINFIAWENFKQLLIGFSREEKLILFLYYSEGLTMKEIGKHIGVCESRVSQVHSICIKRLRARLKEKTESPLSKSA